jgi:UDP-N-acetylbacillosamine N-acetyltransferase
MIKELYLIGSGGLGREVFATLKSGSFTEKYHKVYFIDSKTGIIDGVEIIGNNEVLLGINYPVDVIICVGNCNSRERIINEISSNSNLNFPTFIHPKSDIYNIETVKIGKGCFIGQNTIITTNVLIDDFCFVNSNVSLHHDVILNKNCVLMPGVRITGGAEVGNNTYIGTNYSITENLIIEPNSILKV